MNNEYIGRLQRAIRELYGVDSQHVKSVPVLDTFRGQTIWNGLVEIFEVFGHPKAKLCFAWVQPGSDKSERERLVAILQTPPVNSPLAAVRADIIRHPRKTVIPNPRPRIIEKTHRSVCRIKDNDLETNGECDVVFDVDNRPYAVVKNYGQALELTPLDPVLLRPSPAPEYEFVYLGYILVNDPRN